MNLNNPLTENYFKLKETVLSSNFPWFYHENTIADDNLKFSFYSHVVMHRVKQKEDIPKILSPPLYDLSVEVIREILSHNFINLSKIYRVNFNSTHSNATMSSPHVDHFFDHRVLLVYFSPNNGGNTFIFKDKYPTNFMNYDMMEIEKSFNPDEDSILSFDGLKYHCQGSPSSGNRRVVMVATYEST